MIALSWMLFALLALFFTAAAWLLAAATGWAAQALATGSAAEAARELTTLSLPAWLPPGLGAEWLQPLQALAQWALDVAGAGLPLAGTAAGWLVPAIWIAWGLGMLVLLLLGGAAHVLLRRIGGKGDGDGGGPARIPQLNQQRY
jgi:hypothetical protein